MLTFESCKAADGLLAAGYREVDRMTVLFSKGRIDVESQTGVVDSTKPRAWAIAYLRAFYGSVELAGVVGRVATLLLKSRSVTLLEATKDGEIAGVLAMFRTPGIAGAYCVGVVPEHRRRGVATGLLARAREIAETEGRTLILQTLASDGALDFYKGRGFEEMYAKWILEKSSND